MIAGYTREEFESLKLIDLTTVKLNLPTRGVQDGHGRPVNPKQVIEEFDRALRNVFTRAKQGKPLPAEFVVPDLWHMAKGRAKVVSGVNSDRLWDAHCIAVRLGRTFYGREAVESREHHPGSVFYEPLAEPKWHVPEKKD